MNIDTLIPAYDEKKRLTPPELFEEIINTVRQIFFTDETKRYVFDGKPKAIQFLRYESLYLLVCLSGTEITRYGDFGNLHRTTKPSERFKHIKVDGGIEITF